MALPFSSFLTMKFSSPYFLGYILTLICQELSHFTSLKFLPRLLLVLKHTLRILTGPPSPENCSSGPASVSFCRGLGTFQDRVSPDITSYIVKAGLASSHQNHPLNREKKNNTLYAWCFFFFRWDIWVNKGLAGRTE